MANQDGGAGDWLTPLTRRPCGPHGIFYRLGGRAGASLEIKKCRLGRKNCPTGLREAETRGQRGRGSSDPRGNLEKRPKLPPSGKKMSPDPSGQFATRWRIRTQKMRSGAQFRARAGPLIWVSQKGPERAGGAKRRVPSDRARKRTTYDTQHGGVRVPTAALRGARSSPGHGLRTRCKKGGGDSAAARVL